VGFEHPPNSGPDLLVRMLVAIACTFEFIRLINTLKRRFHSGQGTNNVYIALSILANRLY
jgi:hypothetical protein